MLTMPSRLISLSLAFVLLAFNSSTADGQATQRSDDLIDRLLREPVPRRAVEANLKFDPPGDDAPIEQLVGFWSSTEIPETQLDLTPTEKVRHRLLSGCAHRPQALPALLKYLPKTPDACDVVKSIYDQPRSSNDEGWKPEVRKWLMLHGNFFRPDLIAAAAACSYNGQSLQLDNEEELTALSQLDWPDAENLLKKYVAGTDSRVAAVARALLYRRAIDAKDQAASAELRGILQTTAASTTASPFARNRAFTALLSPDWQGRDAWYLSFFGDSTVDRMEEGDCRFPSPIEEWFHQDLDQNIPTLVGLLSSDDPVVRGHAAWLLSKVARLQAVRPLLPSLTDRQSWATGVASAVVKDLKTVKLPESVPGLIDVCRHGSDDDKPDAAIALAYQGAKEAPAALRQAFSPDRCSRGGQDELIGAMLACGALSDDQIASAIECFATGLAPGLPGDDSLLRCGRVAEILRGKVSGRADMADRLLARVLVLRRENRVLASALAKELLTWPAAPIDREVLRELREDPLNETVVENVISRADWMRAHVPDGLRELACGAGERAGLAAAVLADPDVTGRVLAGNDSVAKLALLAGARLLRSPLSVQAVAPLMASPDSRLASAAEGCLVASDTPEARRAVLARHPGEALVLGDGEVDKGFREELMGKNGPDEIFALFGGGGFGNPGNQIVRIRGNQATIEFQPGNGKSLSRTLTDKERLALIDLVTTLKADDLPSLYNNVLDGVWFTYLHVTRAGGRSIYINNPDTFPNAGSAYDRLTRSFRDLPGAGPLRAHYDIEDSMPGTHLIFSDPKHQITAVWKKGDEMRVLVNPAPDGLHAWKLLRNGTLAGPAEMPEPNGSGGHLQPTTQPNEAWYAAWDEQARQTRLGRYDLKEFKLKPVMSFPGLCFDSDEMWVDEPGEFVYLAVNGDLLQVPLRKP